jgi:hypothetical protein
MEKLVRIVSIHKNDAYHNDKFLIGEIGTLEFLAPSLKGYFSGTFIKLYRNLKDTQKYHSHTFYAIKVAEVIAESGVTRE